MPPCVLHNQIPHSLFFHHQPLYFLPPHVFKCTCFVHVFTPRQEKLSPKPQNASSWDIPSFRRVIVDIPLLLVDISSPLMSPSLRIPPSSPLVNLSLFPMSYHFLHFIHPSCPLQVYRRRHLVVEILANSPIELSSFPSSALPSIDDLPIAL